MLVSLRKRIFPQPAIACALAGGVTLLIYQIHAELLDMLFPLDMRFALIAAALAIALITANAVTIHISYHTKTTLSDCVLLLISVLLPPVGSLLVALVATLLSLVLHKRKRSLYWSDILTDSARFGLICFVASGAHQLLVPAARELIRFGVPAGLLLFGDMITMPLLIAPMSNARPWQIMRSVFRDILLVDGTQYLCAIPIAVVAFEAPHVLLLLVVPLVIVYRAFRGRYHLQDNTRQLLEQMADIVDLRDPYTGGHSRRVAEYTALLLSQLALTGHDTDLIVTAARLHDIGKIGIPDAVLNKPGRLTDDERKLMEQHPVLGANLLLRYPDFARGVAIVRHHHERLDGTGYPDGLAGDAIPFGARVIAVADTWDALTSDRPYRPGLSAEQAGAILCEGRGTQWSAELVGALLIALGHADLLTRADLAQAARDLPAPQLLQAPPGVASVPARS